MEFGKRNVLFIAPDCYGYEKAVQKALLQSGYNVNFISESIDRINLINRILIGYFPKSALTHALIRGYFKKRATAGNDYVLVIRGGIIPAYILEMLRKHNPDARFIYIQCGQRGLQSEGKRACAAF